MTTKVDVGGPFSPCSQVVGLRLALIADGIRPEPVGGFHRVGWSSFPLKTSGRVTVGPSRCRGASAHPASARRSSLDRHPRARGARSVSLRSPRAPGCHGRGMHRGWSNPHAGVRVPSRAQLALLHPCSTECRARGRPRRKRGGGLSTLAYGVRVHNGPPVAERRPRLHDAGHTFRRCADAPRHGRRAAAATRIGTAASRAGRRQRLS